MKGNKLRNTVAASVGVLGLLLAGCEANGGLGSGGGGGGGNGGGEARCTEAIEGAGATIDSVLPGGACLSCSVDNPENLIDTNETNFALYNLTLALAGGSMEVTVKAPPGVSYPGGNIAGFTVAIPAAALASAQALPDIKVKTYLNGVPVTERVVSAVLDADVAGALANETPIYVGVTTTGAFNQVQLEVDATVLGVAGTVRALNACANGTAEGGYPGKVL